jgi:hypothetical protein
MRPEDMRTSEAGLEASTFGESIYDEQQLPFEQPWKTWDREVRLGVHGCCSSAVVTRQVLHALRR